MAETIEGRVIQKIATQQEWEASTIFPKKGEFMLVSDTAGKVINIKVGDGIRQFSELEYMFDTIQQNVNYIPYSDSPSVDNAFTIVGVGTYGTIVVPSGKLGILFWNGTSWSLQDSVELPVIPIDQEIITTSSNAVTDNNVLNIFSIPQTYKQLFKIPNKK